MSLIEIYHIPRRGATIDDLLSEGLKSARKLIEERKIKDYGGSWLFPDHKEVIYFQWFPPHLEFNREENDWISIEVDPQNTYVYNREFRVTREINKYRASRMKLSDYISKHEITKRIKKTLEPGKTIIWNPLTADPVVVNWDDERVSDFTWQYLNEIIIPATVIPPSEFKGYHKKNTV